MNVKFFENYMQTEPKDMNHSYIFLVDRQELAQNILCAGFQPLCIRDGAEGYFSVQSFMDYMDEIAMTGSSMMSYTYVTATGTKSLNEKLQEYLQRNGLKCRSGWTLFYEKDYLEKIGSLKTLTAILERFILSYECPPEYPQELEQFHEVDKKGKPLHVLDLNIVEHLIREVDFFVIGETPFVYEHGVYLEDEKGIRLKSMIQGLVYRNKVTQPTVNRIYQLLISQSGVQKNFEDLNNHPKYWVNFRNGIYDPIENKMMEHDPKYLFVYQIPHEYHPEDYETYRENCENIMKYLNYSLPDPEDQVMMWQYLGYCMTGDTGFQKFMILLGDGGTGKSVLIDLFDHIVGPLNCSHVSMQDMNRRFYASNLRGKLLNSCGDIPCRAMETTDVLKKATGEDMILYERKGQDPLFFKSHAKLLFSANEMPENLDDKSDALYRRLLILGMNRKIPQEMRDPQLKEKIHREADYIIHKAMCELSDLYFDNRFTESKNSIEAVQVVQRASDSTKAFCDEKLEPAKGQKIERSLMYRMYETYCEEAERKPLGKKRFNFLMEQKGYRLKKSTGRIFYTDVKEKDEFIPVDDPGEIPFP